MKNLLGKVSSLFGPKAQPKPSPTEKVQAHAQGPQAAPFVAFTAHNEIEELLTEAAVKPEARVTFQRALLEADLFAATPQAPAQSDVRLSSGESVQLLNVQGPDGPPVAAIFTAQERIVEVFGMGVGYVGIRGETLLEMVAGTGAWLNPGFPYSVHWKPGELAALLGKAVPHVVEKDTKIMLGVPAEPPTALIESLKAILGKDRRIAEAWFALAHWPEDGKSSWHLDVRTNVDGSAVQAMLAETFKRADYAGRPLDMVVNKPGGSPGTGIRIAPLQTH